MNRQDLIRVISSDAQISRLQADRVLDSFIRRVQETIVRGEKVKLAGFGTFQLTRTVARHCSHPRTGESMQIEPQIRPRFTPSTQFVGRIRDRWVIAPAGGVLESQK